MGFYQQLLNGVVTYRQLGNKLIQSAEQANAFRQLDRVRELAEILIGLPIKEYQHIGQYFLALSVHRNGKGDVDTAQNILNNVVDKLHSNYKAKAIFLLAAVSARKRDYDSELYYLNESLKIRGTINIFITAQRGIAISKARAGYNNQALKELENLIPLLRYLDPKSYYDYLNSYAVELGEVGRIEEAQNVCRITLASPFVFAYPEWRETWQDLALRGYKSRSVVPVLKPALDSDNVVPLPVVERNPDPPQQGRAKLFDLQKWAKKMGKKPNGNGKKLPENMTSRDMVIKLMNLTTQEGISDEKLQKIIDYVEKLLSEPD